MMTDAERFEYFRAELAQIRQLLENPPRPDDLVGVDYIHARTGLALRTIQEGKAGTNAIPRVRLSDGGDRQLIRFARADVDNWIRARILEAANTPKARALHLLKTKKQRRRA